MNLFIELRNKKKNPEPDERKESSTCSLVDVYYLSIHSRLLREK